MKLSLCAVSIPLMLGIVIGVFVHPVAGMVLGAAVLTWNVVQARRGGQCTTCAWPRQG